MLSDSELEALFEKFETPPSGRQLIRQARNEAPVRRVHSSIGSGNVITHFFSKKMGRVIQTESLTAEQQGAYLYEFDPHVLEYWPQPFSLDVAYTVRTSGVKTRFQHIPDFLIIRDDGIHVDEWKQASRLASLSVRQPDRYNFDGREWRSPILEQFCSNYGIQYRIQSTEFIPHTRISNYKFLADYLDPALQESRSGAFSALEERFKDLAEIPLWALIDESRSENPPFTSDDIYLAIARGHLHFDAEELRLYETDRVHIYRDAISMRLLKTSKNANSISALPSLSNSLTEGSTIYFDGREFKVTMVGLTECELRSDQGRSPVRLTDLKAMFMEGRIRLPDTNLFPEINTHSVQALTPYQMEAIEKRLELISAYNTNNILTGISLRTVQRYMKAMREAGYNLIDKHAALAPKTHLSGPRKPRISDKLIEIIKHIKKEHNEPRAPSKSASYTSFQQECASANITPCSFKTFCKYLEVVVRRREGARIAYQKSPIVWYLYRSDPIHGVRPFEIVHIDCTPIELVLRTPWSKKSLGVVQLCFAMDAATRVILGLHLSFEKPSYRTTMMVIRDMVLRHGRMPEILVIDKGPENRSIQLRRFCVLTGTTLRERVSGAPREGTVLERMFGLTHTEFIYQLDGNTKIRKHYRSVTKSVRPENFNTWTLPALHGALWEFLTDIYGKERHPALGEPPLEYLERRLAETGQRCNRMVAFDRRFLIETCPAPHGHETRQLDPLRGIKISYIWYWSDEFKQLPKKSVMEDIRIDPWDPGVAFVLINNVWVECISKFRALLSQLTWLELRYVINDLYQTFKAVDKKLSEEQIIARLRLLDPSNFDPRLRAQQEEARRIYEGLGTAAVNGPISRSQKASSFLIPVSDDDTEDKEHIIAEVGNSQTNSLSNQVVNPAFLIENSNSLDWTTDEDFTLL